MEPGTGDGSGSGRGSKAKGRGHARRRAARRQAVDLLYQADVMGRSPSDVLEEWRAAGRDVHPYAAELVAGVERAMSGIDEELGRYSEGWTVSRMAAVDRTILRVASYEIRSGIPPAVAINEAVQAANELSTEDSGRFVNGVLGKIARDAEPAAPDQA
jgi:transcription antitermination protein NusB